MIGGGGRARRPPGRGRAYRAGDDKARKKLRGFLMGGVMTELKGRGNTAVLNRLLDEALGRS